MEKKYADFFQEGDLLRIVFITEEPTPIMFDEYLLLLKAFYEKNEKLAVLFDARKAKGLESSLRLKQVEWLKENEELIREKIIGTAYVLPSLFMRIVLQTIFYFKQQPVPYLITNSVEEGEIWLKKQLEGVKQG